MPHCLARLALIGLSALPLTACIINVDGDEDGWGDDGWHDGGDDGHSHQFDIFAQPGIWRQHGYAQLLEIDATGARTYDISQVSCTPSGEWTHDELDTDYEVLEADRNGFAWRERGNFTEYNFDRLDRMPEACVASQDTGPEATFEALWWMFQENYVSFEIRGVDWQAMYDLHRPRVHAGTTQEELMSIFQDMLLPLDDGHVWVFDGVANGFLGSGFGQLWEAWAGEYPGDPVGGDIANPRGLFTAEMRNYVLQDILAGAGQSAVEDYIQWGHIAPRVGYINLMQMAGRTELSLPQLLEAVDQQMQIIRDDLRDARAIVIDTRFNEGGKDIMGFAIAEWFTDRTVSFAHKRAKTENGFTPDQELRLEATVRDPFRVPVFVLTSRNTVSAAETFAMAMREVANVTLVGTHTHGIFSDSLVRVLPNGWAFAQSNEIYESIDGQNFESIGVPPDLQVAFDPGLGYFENLRKVEDTALASIGR